VLGGILAACARLLGAHCSELLCCSCSCFVVLCKYVSSCCFVDLFSSNVNLSLFLFFMCGQSKVSNY
jgi:hypothetical protein